jgi:tetratricopeptide (TPR) repeat protein
VAATLDDAERLRDQGRWAEARAVAERAEARLGRGGPADLRRRLEQVLAELHMVDRLEEVRLEQSAVKDDRFDAFRGAALYAAAFRNHGLDVEALSPAEFARRVASSPIREPLATALDNWARALPRTDTDRRQRLLAVARLADPDEWRNCFRDSTVYQNRAALEELARRPEVARLPAATAANLGQALREARAPGPVVIEVLRQARQRHPRDFWINHDLGIALLHRDPPALDEAVGLLRVAVALRPQSPGAHLNLAFGLRKQENWVDAAACYRRAIELKQDHVMAHVGLGAVLQQQGRHAEAEATFRQAIRLRPEEPAHYSELGAALAEQGKSDEAAAAHQRAIVLKPDFALAHCVLGLVRSRQGRFAAALVALRRGHELGSRTPGWAHPSAAWVKDAERWADLEARLPAVRRGLVRPGGPPSVSSTASCASASSSTPRRPASTGRRSRPSPTWPTNGPRPTVSTPPATRPWRAAGRARTPAGWGRRSGAGGAGGP